MEYSLDLRDFRLLNELAHHGSMRSLARSLGVTPQHLSKIMVGLEKKCGARLLTRSPKGVSLTPEAVRYASLAEKVLVDIESFKEEGLMEPKGKIKSYTLVSRVFMNVCFSAPFSVLVEKEFPSSRMRFVDASPKKKEEWTRKEIVDFVLSPGVLDLGRTWQGEEVGQLEWSFYCRAGHPLGRSPKRESLMQHPLIAHSHVDGTRLVEDVSTHPYKNLRFRFVGSSTETALSSMQIIKATNSIAFLPDLLVREHSPDKLQRLSVMGIEPMRQPVFFYAHQDRVPSLLFRRLTMEAKRILTP
jgi:DNA-binding transcriptional LysR family regulator